jgi:hypothetical protein
VREAGDKARLDRIGGDAAHDQGDGAGGLLGRKARWRTRSHDESHIQVDQRRREFGEAIVAVLR